MGDALSSLNYPINLHFSGTVDEHLHRILQSKREAIDGLILHDSLTLLYPLELKKGAGLEQCGVPLPVCRKYRLITDQEMPEGPEHVKMARVRQMFLDIANSIDPKSILVPRISAEAEYGRDWERYGTRFEPIRNINRGPNGE